MFILEFIEEMLSMIGLGSLATLGVVGSLLLWIIYILLGILLLVIAIGVLYAMYYWPREFIYRVLLRRNPPSERIMMWFEQVDKKIDAYIETMNNDA